MNSIFSCPSCNIQTDSFVPDQRSDWFACCLCTNSRCTVSHFVACRLCECNNTGNNKHWYRNHLQRKEHKQHVRNLELASQNFNSNHLVTSNDNNTESPNPYDDITVQSNDDNNDALINNTSLYDDDNEVLNVDHDYDTNVVLHSNNVDTATIIHNGDTNESVTIPNDSNIDNHIVSIINKDGSTIINKQLLPSNNCCNLKGVVDSCHSIDQYIKYLQDTSKEVNKDMINQLALSEQTYKKHRDYFFACIENKGPNYVVHKSLGQSDHQYMQRNNINTMHALLQTKLCMSLTIEERTYYASILRTLLANPEQLIRNSHNSKSFDCSNIPKVSLCIDGNNSTKQLPLYAPCSAADIRTDLMEGQNSILSNLPTPEPQHDKPSGYIYIPLKESIIFMFASQNPPVPFLPFDGCVHAKSEKKNELLPELQSDFTGSTPNNCFFLEVIIWADGFLAHQFSVTSEASAHVCFITIGAPNGDQSGKNTFLVWLGPQKNSPENVEQLLVNEINRLSSSYFPVYHHKMKRVVNVKLKLFVFLGDKIEKYKRLGLLQGQAYCARFGYVGDLMHDFEKISCCDECQLHLLRNNVAETNKCSCCYSFDFSGKTYQPNKNYPTNSLFGVDDMILPYKIINLENLPAIMNKAFTNYVNREKGWTTKAAINSFLRSKGLCNTLQRQLTDNAARLLLYNNTLKEANGCTESALVCEIVSDFKNCPDDYKVPQCPHFWGLVHSAMYVRDYIDVPAHLLFLGVAKSLYKDIYTTFLSGTKKTKSFVSLLNDKLYVLSNAKIAYVAVKEKAGDKELKFTEFLSKHYTLLCRCSKWLFNHFGKSKADKNAVAVVPTHNRYFEYKKKEIFQFCQERLIACPLSDKTTEKNCRTWFCDMIIDPITSFADYNDEDISWFIYNENKTELNELIELDTDHRRMIFFNYICKHQSIPPKRLFVFHSDVSEMAMNMLTQLLHCIISRAMIGGEDIDRHVKLFLTQTNRIEQKMEKAASKSKKAASKSTKRKQDLPLIIGRMNFISLLNLQATVNRYGPMRLLWELGPYGEGSIPSIKKLISSTQIGYAVPVSKKYLNNIAIKNSFLQLKESTSAAVPTATQNKLTDRDGTAVCDAMYKTNNDCPIGQGCIIIPVVVSLCDETIYMYDKQFDQYRQCKIMNNNMPVTECGATYFYFQCTEHGTTVPSHALLSNDIVVGLMMRHSDTKHLYYVIRWDWTELIVAENDTIAFDSPRFEDCSY